MGAFYFDESIHPKGQFALGAFSYSEDPLDGPVTEALRQSGLMPFVDEFKSSARMHHSPKLTRARELLKSLIYKHCRIGVVVAPDHPRHLLGCEAMFGLKKILSTNQFKTASHEIFFDEGIFENKRAGEAAAGAVAIVQRCDFHFEQDSVQVPGLQIADLIAHTCATMLLAELGIAKKMVKAGENSGYDPGSDMELEFELWASLRYNFFAAAPPPVNTWKSQLDFQVDVASRGLHVANACDENVRSAAVNRFGNMYLGCIHQSGYSLFPCPRTYREPGQV